MTRFRKYNLLKEFNGVRLIHKAIPDRDYGYVMPEAHIYRVQTHKRFFRHRVLGNDMQDHESVNG